MWEFGGMLSLHSFLADVIAGKSQGSQDLEGAAKRRLFEQFETFLRHSARCLFKNLEQIVQSGDTHIAQMARKSDTINLPQQWIWVPRKSASALLSNGSRTVKKRPCDGEAVILGSQGFQSGVHSWVVEIQQGQAFTLGVCLEAMCLHGSNSSDTCWYWYSGRALPGPGNNASYAKGDSVRLELDLNKGTLTFYKNDKREYFVGNVAGTVYPFVRLRDDGDQVTLKKCWKTLQVEDIEEPEDLAHACSRVICNTSIVLRHVMHKADTHFAAQQDTCAVVIDIVLEEFCHVCEALSTHARKSSHLSVISLFERLTRTRAPTVDEALGYMPGWLACVLACLSQIEDLRCMCRLLPRMYAVVQSGVQLVRTCPSLRSYQGAAMQSYSLGGWRFSPNNHMQKARHLRIDHGPALDADWTLEFVLMCARTRKSQASRVLAATRDFNIVLVYGPEQQAEIQFHEVIGKTTISSDCRVGAQTQAQDQDQAQTQAQAQAQAQGLVPIPAFGAPRGERASTTSNSAGQRSSPCEWFSDAKCPLDRWTLLSFVCKAGSTSIFVEGRCVGTVGEKFALALTAIGCCSQSTQIESFSGQVRECRVYSVARSQADMLRCVCAHDVCAFGEMYQLIRVHVDASLSQERHVLIRSLCTAITRAHIAMRIRTASSTERTNACTQTPGPSHTA
jgi:hypothetical protein